MNRKRGIGSGRHGALSAEHAGSSALQLGICDGTPGIAATGDVQHGSEWPADDGPEMSSHNTGRCDLTFVAGKAER